MTQDFDHDEDAREGFQHFVSVCQRCRACDLAANRQNVVVWRGNIKAPLMIIGEGPGAEEDEQGIPFVGRSGQLLDQLLTAWEIREDDFHICNIVKCRPPGNRAPKPEEAEKCRPLLTRQFNLVRPRVILLMGGTAYKYFTHDDTGITKVRGRWIQKAGYWILPTFHPAYVLRDPRRKNDLWQDIAAVRRKLSELKLLPELIT
ncbi:MAG: uracil-DNA glycosylase [Clostridiaceae bacterium]|nr:uracil-DNA glycosylase [Clostridiaceae bacterium]